MTKDIDNYHPFSGRFVKEDGTTVNIADELGGKSVSDKVYDIDNMMPHSGRFIKEDGTCVNIADMIANGDIGGGGGSGSGSSDDSAPPIIETYNGQTIQCFMSADRPIKGLNLYATCEQKTTAGANLINPNGIEIGGLGGPTGGPFIANNRIRTGSIPVTEGERYFMSGYSPYTIANSHIFNGEGGRIAAFTNDNAIPSGGVSVRISFSKNESELTNEDVNALKSTLMFNKGESALPYEPYTGGKPSPSPEYPQEIQTISDFVVEVKNSMGGNTTPQTLNVRIPEQGFYGIPVKSGGNYTDLSGQQWICDEFDFTNKKFIKRTKRISLDGSEDETWIRDSASDGKTRFYIALANGSSRSGLECLCNRLIYGTSGKSGFCFITNARFYIDVEISISTVELLRDFLNTHPLDVIYPLETPVKYDMTDAEIEPYKKLRSYYGTTHIDNDAVPACNMTAELVVDTKMYIDSKFTTLAGQILEMGV